MSGSGFELLHFRICSRLLLLLLMLPRVLPLRSVVYPKLALLSLATRVFLRSFSSVAPSSGLCALVFVVPRFQPPMLLPWFARPLMSSAFSPDLPRMPSPLLGWKDANNAPRYHARFTDVFSLHVAVMHLSQNGHG